MFRTRVGGQPNCDRSRPHSLKPMVVCPHCMFSARHCMLYRVRCRGNIAYNVVAIGCGTRAYDIVGQTYNIVCKHMVSMFKTTSYVSLQYRIPDMRYCMSKYVPSTAYDIE